MHVNLGGYHIRDIEFTAAFDVTATTDVVMCCFRKKPFETLTAETPHVA